MPIRPQHRWLYPIDWRELSVSIRFGRAAGRCEACGRPHGRTVVHLGDGRWWDSAAGFWRCGAGKRVRLRALPACDAIGPPGFTTRVVLAAAHRDHDPTNNAPANLAAWCQRCHLLHDRDEHRRRRAMTLRARRACGDLFAGPYPAPRRDEPKPTCPKSCTTQSLKIRATLS